MRATTNVTLEKNYKIDKKEIVISKIFTHKYNLAMAWIIPRQYLDPMQTNLHSSGRYRTKRACTQIENRRYTSRYTGGLPQMQVTYSLRYHS